MSGPTIGIVAMLDILGYKALISSAKLEDLSRLISETLLAEPQRVSETLHHSLRGAPDVTLDRLLDHKDILERMVRLVFADTVLLALPLRPTDRPEFFLGQLGPFLACTSLICRRFFDAGLPLRGAVSLGSFVVEQYCFAGDAILKAHAVGQQLEFAGCAVEDETRRAIVGADGHLPEEVKRVVAPPFRRLLFSSEVATKSGPQRLMLVRWGNPFDEWGPLPDDTVRYVEESFTAHGKTMNSEVRLKAENTVAALEDSRIFPGQTQSRN